MDEPEHTGEHAHLGQPELLRGDTIALVEPNVGLPQDGVGDQPKRGRHQRHQQALQQLPAARRRTCRRRLRLYGSRWRRERLDGVIGDPPVRAPGRRPEVGALAIVEGTVRLHGDPPNKATRCAEAAR
jgi:hypothetical protein